MPKPNASYDVQTKRDIDKARSNYDSVSRAYHGLTEKEKALVNYDIQNNPDRYSSSASSRSLNNNQLYNSTMEVKGLDAVIPDQWWKQIPTKNGVFNAIGDDGTINQAWQRAYDNLGVLKPFLRINSTGTPEEEKNAGNFTLSNLALQRYRQLATKYKAEAQAAEEEAKWNQRVYQKDGVIDEASTKAFQALSLEEKKLINGFGSDGKPSAVASQEELEAYQHFLKLQEEFGYKTTSARSNQVFANTDGTVDKGKTRAFQELTAEEQAIIQKLGKNGYPSGLTDMGDLAVFNKFNDATQRYNREYASQELAKMQTGTKYATSTTVRGGSSRVDLSKLPKDEKERIANQYSISVEDVDDLIKQLANQLPADRRESIRSSLGAPTAQQNIVQQGIRELQSADANYTAQDIVNLTNLDRSRVAYEARTIDKTIAAMESDVASARKVVADSKATPAAKAEAKAVINNYESLQSRKKQAAKDNRVAAVVQEMDKLVKSVDALEKERKFYETVDPEGYKKQIALIDERLNESPTGMTLDQAVEYEQQLKQRKEELEAEYHKVVSIQTYAKYMQEMQDAGDHAADIISKGMEKAQVDTAVYERYKQYERNGKIRFNTNPNPNIAAAEQMVENAAQRGYDYLALEGEDRRLYEFVLGEHGQTAADELLESLRGTINYRRGEELAKSVAEAGGLGEFFRTVGLALNVGLEQFNTGMLAATNGLFGAQQLDEDEKYNATPTEVASGITRERLGESGAKLPEWLGGATLSQSAYDLVVTTANMAPSLLISAGLTAAGLPEAGAGLISSAVLGSSAGGNAYRQAIQEGRTETAARNFGVLVGASEGALQYLLGGISELGGMATGATAEAVTERLGSSVFNAAMSRGATEQAARLMSVSLRVASNLGLDMLSEGSEEYLQDLLEPVFKNICFDEHNQIRLWSEDAAYSFLLGAISAGLMEGPASLSTSVNQQRVAEAKVALENYSYISNLIKESDQAIIDIKPEAASDEELERMRPYTGAYEEGTTQVRVPQERYDAVVNSSDELVKAWEHYNFLTEDLTRQLESGRRMSTNEIRQYAANVKAARDKLIQTQQAMTASRSNWKAALEEAKVRANEAAEAARESAEAESAAEQERIAAEQAQQAELNNYYASAVLTPEQVTAWTNIADVNMALDAQDIQAMVDSGIAPQQAQALMDAYTNYSSVGDGEQNLFAYQLDEARDNFVQAAQAEIQQRGAQTLRTTDLDTARRVTEQRNIQQQSSNDSQTTEEPSAQPTETTVPPPLADETKRHNMRKTTVYRYGSMNGKVGVSTVSGWTDGVYNYYKEGKTWYAIDPVSGLSITSSTTRQGAQSAVYSQQIQDAIRNRFPDNNAAANENYRKAYDAVTEARNAGAVPVEEMPAMQSPSTATTEQLTEAIDAVASDPETTRDNPTAQKQVMAMFDESESRERQDNWQNAKPTEKLEGTTVNDDGIRYNSRTGSYLDYKMGDPDPQPKRGGPRGLVHGNDLMRMLFDAFNVTGTVRNDAAVPKGAAGYYNPRTDFIQLKNENAVPSAIHEVGHRADFLYGLGDVEGIDEIWQQFPQEIKDFYNNDPELLRAEAKAEAFKMYVNNPDKARQFWPQFVEALEANMDSVQRNAVQKVSQAVRDEAAASISEQIGNTIKDPTEGNNKLQNLWDTIYSRARGFEGLTQAMTDVEAIFSRLDSSFAKQFGGLSKGKWLYVAAKDLLSVSGRAMYMLTNGGIVVERNGQYVREKTAYADIFKNLTEEQVADVGKYLKTKEGLWRENRQNKKVFPDTIDREAAVKWLYGMENSTNASDKAVVQAAEDAIEWFHTFMSEVIVPTGLISKASWVKFVAENPNYVPMQRDLFEQNTNGEGSNPATPITRKMVGSEADTIDPIIEFAEVVQRMLAKAERAKFDRELYQRIKQLPDSANFAQIVDVNGVVDRETLTTGPESMFWTQSAPLGMNMENDILPIRMEDGSLQYLQLNDAGLKTYYENVTRYADTQRERDALMNNFGKFLHSMTRLRANLLTGINVQFALRNPQKDFVEYATTSETENNPAKLLFQQVMGFIDVAKSRRATKAEGDVLDAVELYQYMGGSGGLYGSLREVDTLRDLKGQIVPQTRSNFKKLKQGANDILSYLGEIGEQGTRVAEFKRVLEKSKGDVRLAFYEANRSTVDFRGSGTATGNLKNVMLFMGASLNSFNKDMRSLTGKEFMNEDGTINHKAQAAWLAKKAAYIAVPAMLQQLIRSKTRKDEDDLVPDYMEDSDFLMPIPGMDGFYLRWALPEGATNAIFREIGQMAGRLLSGEDMKFFESFCDITDALSPIGEVNANTGFMGSSFALAPVIQAALNRRWNGGTIDSEYDLSRSPELRYSASTTELAKTLGNRWGISPKRIDYVLDQSGSWLYDDYKMIENLFTGKTSFWNAPQEMLDSLTSRFITNVYYNTDALSEFYSAQATIETIINDIGSTSDHSSPKYKKGLSEEELERAEKEANDLKDEFFEYSRSLTEIRNQIKDLTNKGTWKYNRQMLDLQKQYAELAMEGMLHYELFKENYLK